jgi:hypothetical protein
MNTLERILAASCLAVSTNGAVAEAAEPELCRGGYPVLLMTDLECTVYLQRVHAVRAAGQRELLLRLQHQHAELLRERAAACPCALPVETPPAVQVALVAPDC